MNPERASASLVPDWMRGLWRRRSITFPDGRHDDTTIVYWLQTASAFADIRIPADRPDLRSQGGGFDALTEVELAALVRQGGFAGWTELAGDQCSWHRDIDFQPPSGVPDEGRLRLRDGLLIEDGVHEAYVEIWEPIDCGPGPPDIVHRVEHAGRLRELLAVCGDVFIFARDRRVALPRASSLAALLHAAPPGASEIAQWLDCEISYGLRRGGAVPWEVCLSTVPFRQGRSLALATDGGVTC